MNEEILQKGAIYDSIIPFSTVGKQKNPKNGLVTP